MWYPSDTILVAIPNSRAIVKASVSLALIRLERSVLSQRGYDVTSRRRATPYPSTRLVTNTETCAVRCGTIMQDNRLSITCERCVNLAPSNRGSRRKHKRIGECANQ